MNFIARHGLWNSAQIEAGADIMERVSRDKIEVIRLSFPDIHGLLRGKALLAASLPAAMRDGLSLTSTLLLKDSSHRTVTPVFSAGAGLEMPELQGAADVILVPDPLTFRVLPWADKTAIMLGDIYFADGRPVPFATRSVMREMLARLAGAGYRFAAGLEVEFHITRLLDAKLAPEDSGQPGTPPDIALLHQGYNYLTDDRLDQMEPILEILRRDIVALGLPLASVEVEFGPSQCEFVFRHGEGMQPADDMVLFRSAVKQICRRHGYHATFMCRPALPNIMSSGWHLHQSLIDESGGNAFSAPDAPNGLSATGRHYLAGLLEGALGAAAFTTPTINGYKRFRPNSLAPDRIAWGRENRGAMLRVITGTSSSACRIENRVGEPAANPYLYMASQIACGLEGLTQGVEPPPAVDSPYETEAAKLPSTLENALSHLHDSSIMREAFGDDFVNYFIMIKQHEVVRYNQHVSDWEHREYFGLF